MVFLLNFIQFCIFSKITLCRPVICEGRFLFRTVKADVFLPATYHDPAAPFMLILHIRNALEPGRAVFHPVLAGIERVLLVRDKPEVASPVIQPVPINVNNFMRCHKFDLLICQKSPFF